MGQMKNKLLEQLESNPVFAERYWQLQDQYNQEPVLPESNQLNLNQSFDNPPF